MKEKEYGSYILRLFAYIFDHLLLCLVPLVIFFLVVDGADSTAKFGLGTLWVIWELIFLQWLLTWSYLVLTYVFLGGSFGKILAGLTIEKEDGTKPTLVDALMRFPVGYSVSTIFWGLGFFWIIKDPKKKGFHDHFAGTVVVKTGSFLPLGIFLPALMLVVGLMVILTITSGANSGLWTAVGEDIGDFIQMIGFL